MSIDTISMWGVLIAAGITAEYMLTGWMRRRMIIAAGLMFEAIALI